MSINSVVRWFKPRETVFFDLLEKDAETLCEAINFFHGEIAANDLGRLPELRRRMKVFEHFGDELHKEIIDRLDQTFVTPIERDDILQLSHAIDDALDHLDAVTAKLVLYNVGYIHESVPEISVQLAEGVPDLIFLMKSLRKMTNVKEIRARILNVQDMESRIDAIYDASMGKLFASSTNAIELIKWKEIIKELEDASDSMALVAKVVGSTVTKNA